MTSTGVHARNLSALLNINAPNVGVNNVNKRTTKTLLSKVASKIKSGMKVRDGLNEAIDETYDKQAVNQQVEELKERVVRESEKVLDDAVNKVGDTINSVAETLKANKRTASYYYRKRKAMSQLQRIEFNQWAEDLPIYNRFEALAEEENETEFDMHGLAVEQVNMGGVYVPRKVARENWSSLQRNANGNVVTMMVEMPAEDKDDATIMVKNEPYYLVDLNKLLHEVVFEVRSKYMFRKRTPELLMQIQQDCRRAVQSRDIPMGGEGVYHLIWRAALKVYKVYAAEGALVTVVGKHHGARNNLSRHNKVVEGLDKDLKSFLQHKSGKSRFFEDGRRKGLVDIISPKTNPAPQQA